MQFVKSVLRAIRHNDLVMRIFHTFWQAVGGALAAGLGTAHSTADVKGVVFVAVTAGLAALKSLVLSKRG